MKKRERVVDDKMSCKMSLTNDRTNHDFFAAGPQGGFMYVTAAHVLAYTAVRMDWFFLH